MRLPEYPLKIINLQKIISQFHINNSISKLYIKFSCHCICYQTPTNRLDKFYEIFYGRLRISQHLFFNPLKITTSIFIYMTTQRLTGQLVYIHNIIVLTINESP